MSKLRNHSCMYCKKVFFAYGKRKYCSKMCSGFGTGHIGGNIGWKKALLTNKRNKTGFFKPGVQSKAGKIGGKIGGVRAQQACRKNKTGFFRKDHKIQKRGGKISGRKNGLATLETLRERRMCPRYDGIVFDSKQELDVCKKFARAFNFKPQKNVNVHVRVGHKEYDFFIRRMFVEYHPFDVYITPRKYYNTRRKNLDDNGFKENKLIILKSMKAVTEFVVSEMFKNGQT